MGGVAGDPWTAGMGLTGVREQSLSAILGEGEHWTGKLPPQRDLGRIIRGNTVGIRGGKVCGTEDGRREDSRIAQEKELRLGRLASRSRRGLLLGPRENRVGPGAPRKIRGYPVFKEAVSKMPDSDNWFSKPYFKN